MIQYLSNFGRKNKGWGKRMSFCRPIVEYGALEVWIGWPNFIAPNMVGKGRFSSAIKGKKNPVNWRLILKLKDHPNADTMEFSSITLRTNRHILRWKAKGVQSPPKRIGYLGYHSQFRWTRIPRANISVSTCLQCCPFLNWVWIQIWELPQKEPWINMAIVYSMVIQISWILGGTKKTIFETKNTHQIGQSPGPSLVGDFSPW